MIFVMGVTMLKVDRGQEDTMTCVFFFFYDTDGTGGVYSKSEMESQAREGFRWNQ
jgi:hypothetical protein